MKIRDALIVSKSADIPEELIDEMVSVPYEMVLGYKAVPADFEGRDLIITYGGDGTLLDASKNIFGVVPVLAVKSSDESVGALCQADSCDMKRVLDGITMGRYSLEKWSRVEGCIGNEKETALNEIFVGPRYSSGPGRYRISLGGKDEEQRGSGIIISSGTGSGGWYSNVSGSDGLFPRDSKKLKFIARDYKRGEGYELIRGEIYPGEEMEIESMIKFDGTADFDGYNRKSVNFPKGSSIKIRLSDNPLNMVIPGKNYK